MLTRIKDLSKIGIITDTESQELPDNAFSAGENVRFNNNAVEKFTGHSQIFGTPTVTPYWLVPITTPTKSYWVYAGLNKVYVYDGANHFNITRQTISGDVNYSATALLNWNGGVIEGIPILNNGVDDPQMWNPIGTGVKLTSLTWDSGNTWEEKGHTCAVIRPYKDYLVALDVTKSGTQNERLVKWSTSGLPGAVPTTWDETDATEDAGEVELAQTIGACIDGLTLRDLFIIYKEDSTWGMQFTNGDAIFRFYQLYASLSILTRRCVKEFEGKHFVVGNGDVVIHDGVTPPVSIIDRRRRNELFSNIDSTNYTLTFVSPNYSTQEMWICYPESGQSACTKAMIWNWRENTWGTRTLQSAYHIGYGVINDSGESLTWDSDSDPWDSDSTTWNARTFNPSDRKMVMAATNIYQIDDTNQFSGASFTSSIERTSLFFGDPEMIKSVSALWLRTTGSGTLSVTLGYQMNAGDAIAWGIAQSYTIGSDRKINTRITGRYISYKIESTGNDNWKLLGVAFDINPAGIR